MPVRGWRAALTIGAVALANAATVPPFPADTLPAGARAADVSAETRKSGETFKDCPECPEVVAIPAGTFDMGSPPNEAGRDNDEGPRRQVRIPASLAVGKFEVTFDEWDACVAQGGCGGHRPADRGWGRGRQPAINVSWHDAKAYATWLSKKTGKNYRLPSEAEWEYAARAGTTTTWSCGGNESCLASAGWYNGNAGDRPRPVGGKAANAFGLHDMHGNVREWTEDCWHDDYSGAPSDGSAWLTGGDCSSRVIRGGSWGHNPRILRSADRNRHHDIDDRNVSIGFRVARTF